MPVAMIEKFFDSPIEKLAGVGEGIGNLSQFAMDIAGACVNITPVLGQLRGGYDVFVSWTKVGTALYKQHAIYNRSYAIDIGAPSHAFEALRESLAEEKKRELESAGTTTGAFALNLVGLGLTHDSH
jgi:hypothetical protein